MIRIVDGDILSAPEEYICHQANCLTNHAAGLAKKMFEAFPYADIYSERQNPHVPGPGCSMGDIVVRGNGADQRYVVNMLAQYYPGKAKYPLSKRDGIQARLDAFRSCLGKIAAIDGIRSVGFPARIGCVLAGGDWDAYLGMITEFASGPIEVAVYNFPYPY